MQHTNTQLIKGGKVLLEVNGKLIFQHKDILIKGDRITEIGDEITPESGVEITEARGKYIIPGLINTHSHSYSTLSRNNSPRLPLEAWALFTTADTLNRDGRAGYVSAALGAIEMIRAGVTTVLDHLGGSRESVAGAIDAYREIGLRVAVAPMITDLPGHKTYSSEKFNLPSEILSRLEAMPVQDHIDLLGMTEDLMKQHNQDGSTVTVFAGPHAPQKCSDELLRGAAELAEKYSVGFHTHLLESPIQAYGQKSLVGDSIVKHLQNMGAMNSRFSGAHSIWLTEDDAEILGSAKATVVNNPYSNLKLGSGFAPYRFWEKYRVIQSLGSDGANCGGNLSLMESIRLSTGLQHMSINDTSDWRSQGESLKRSYYGGAHALQKSDEIGAISVGFAADLVFIDARREQFFSAGDEVETLVETMNQSHVDHVMIAGKFVLKDKNIIGIDEEQLFEEATELVAATASLNPDLRELAAEQEPYLTALHNEAIRTYNPRMGNLS